MSKQTGKPIVIASDHAGLSLKAEIQKNLTQWPWLDLGPLNSDRVDYTDFAQLLGHKITDGEADFGVLICGSGIGMSIAANKIAGIRAANVENPVAARLSREHNDANVLCLGSRFIGVEYRIEMTQVWLSTSFSQEQRHILRVKKIRLLEKR